MDTDRTGDVANAVRTRNLARTIAALPASRRLRLPTHIATTRSAGIRKEAAFRPSRVARPGTTRCAGPLAQALKKALDAHTGRVLREYLMEATLIGFLGGAVGYVLGVLLTNVLNVAGRSSNLELFLVTPKLTAIALGFAVALGALAGSIPALRAARLDPVLALRTTN